MSDATIRMHSADGIATITLNRPDTLNAMGPRMALEITAALEACERDPAVRVIVITGAGRAFSSGADLRDGDRGVTPEGKPDLLGALRSAYNPMIVKVRRIPKPVIAGVNGPAVGVSASLAAACDLVVAAASAYFLLAFVNIGLTIDGGASLLFPARAGFGRAAEMALLGERIPAADAHRFGIVNRLADDAEFPAVLAGLAAGLAAGAPGSFAASKALLNAAVFADLEAALEREAVAQQARGESADFVEGVTALFQKRPPTFTGA
jgi:2-(1,2-epoxy-1,2-dihydrophenyl)acetyl-CoA isomerase